MNYFCLILGKRTIDALKVKCSNAKMKCQWKGTVGTLETHVAACDFTMLPCPKKCKGDDSKPKQIMRKDIDNHVKDKCPNRDYKCQYCGKKGTYANITQIHDALCEKKLIACPHHDCTEIVERRTVNKHVTEECGFTVIPCKFKNFGCEVEQKRRDMKAHEENNKQEHLDMTMAMTLKLEKECKELKEEVSDLSATNIMINRSVTLKLTNVKDRTKDNEPYYFPAYYTHPRGYRMVLKVYVNGTDDGIGTHMSVYIVMEKGRYDSSLKWPFIGGVTISLLNQLEDDNHHTKRLTFIRDDNAKVGDSWGYSQFISHSALYFAYNTYFVPDAYYVQDDTIYFRLYVQIGHKPWLES